VEVSRFPRLLGWLLTVTAVLGPSASAEEPKLISQGRRVDLEEHLVPGKMMLFDFYADWCAPCRVIKPRIRELANRYPDVLAVREVDVVDWDSPVARQHRILQLPHLKLFGPDGRLISEGDPQRVMARLVRRLGEPSSSAAPAPPEARSPVIWVVLVGLAVVGVVTWRRLTGGGRRYRRAVTGEVVPAGAGETGDSPPIWFAVVDGSLEGPLTIDGLAELRRQRRVDGSSRVRRRGDATWRQLRDVIDDGR
jgi:thiol-disulfide isomerase/thioredoxin